MRRALAARVWKLEETRKPVVRAPCVVRVRRDETISEAVTRFRAQFPAARGHSLLVVPERVCTSEEEADFAVRFKAQQCQLIADARNKSIDG